MNGEAAAYSRLRELASVRGLERPPLDLWHPNAETSIDMRIDRQGRWWHEGRQITRPRLVRLFSTLLRKEGEDYFLITPVEKCRIQVEDVPFLVVQLAVSDAGKVPTLWFTTSTGDEFPLNEEHPLRVRQEDGRARPCVLVRAGMYGLLERSVWYQLAELAEEAGAALGVRSAGSFFRLGDA